MTGRGEQRAGRFERATGAAVRAIAEREALTVVFGDESSARDSGTHVRLPATGAEPGRGAIARIRGEADFAALRLRHHDAELHRRSRPSNGAAVAIFDALEDARFEALGAQRMPGVAANLATRLDARCLAEGFAEAVDPGEVPESTAFALLMRLQATGRRWPQAADRVMHAWLNRLGARASDEIGRMARSIDDQCAYAAGTQRLLAVCGLRGDAPDTPADELQERSTQLAPDPSAARKAEAPPASATGAEPASAADSTPRTRSDPAVGSTNAVEPRTAIDSLLAEESGRPEGSGSAEASGTAEESDRAEQSDSAEALAAGAEPAESRAPGPTREPLPYRAFTTEHDATATPEDLCDARQLLQWRKRLDRETAPFRAGVVRLAVRLQQRLLAQQASGWDLELEEGLVDAERLASAIADPAAGTVYKALRTSDFPDTVLSILIDNSGSMRGLPIRLAAMCADIVALALERCAVKVEILGFTTRDWRGGRSREQWIRSAMPPQPGRLNDLCHIVYKPASTPWRRARNGIGLMLDEGLLKENVDGEALLWAYRRLLARPEQRRILMVLSDGAPADESTSSTNSPDYLDRHLRQVIARIEHERAVELAAIGLGHDVARYYRHAVKLADPHDLGETLVRSLDALLR